MYPYHDPTHRGPPCRRRWKQDEQTAVTPRPFSIFALTWNVNEGLPDPLSSQFFGHLREQVAPARQYALAVFGLQEIEMGGTSVAAAATRELLRQKKAMVCCLLINRLQSTFSVDP